MLPSVLEGLATLSAPTALDHSDTVPNRFLDQACNADGQSHGGFSSTHSHPSRARSLASQLGPAPSSQRPLYDCSPAYSHHSWSSSHFCQSLRICSPRHRVSDGHEPCFFLRCSLTWPFLCIDIHQSIRFLLLFSPHRIHGYLLLHYLLEVISLRIPWDCRVIG